MKTKKADPGLAGDRDDDAESKCKKSKAEAKNSKRATSKVDDELPAVPDCVGTT